MPRLHCLLTESQRNPAGAPLDFWISETSSSPRAVLLSIFSDAEPFYVFMVALKGHFSSLERFGFFAAAGNIPGISLSV